jgi:hypothetical protein
LWVFALLHNKVCGLINADGLISDNNWRSVCCKLHGIWMVFNFAEELDVIYWWLTHDGVDDVLSGYDFSTKIIHEIDNGTQEIVQVATLAYSNDERIE